MSITSLEKLKKVWGKYVKEKDQDCKSQLIDEMKKSLDNVDGAREFLLEQLKHEASAIKVFHKAEQTNIIAEWFSKDISFEAVLVLLHVDAKIAEKVLMSCKNQTVERIYIMLLDDDLAYISYASKKKWESVCKLCERILK